MKNSMVLGIERMELAKIIGEHAGHTDLDRGWLLWPPYILRPTTRLAYCTGMRRSESFMNTMTQDHDEEDHDEQPGQGNKVPERRRVLDRRLEIAHEVADCHRHPGDDTRKQQDRDPFPTPFSLICSPSHIKSAVPAVKTAMITIAANTIEKPPASEMLCCVMMPLFFR